MNQAARKDVEATATSDNEITDEGFPVIHSHGVRFPQDPAFISPRHARLLGANEYEERESNAVITLLRRRDIVIELGAGIGYMSAVAAKRCKCREVHAFEANPRLIPFIRRVHQMNDIANVTVHNTVLGRAHGTTDFYIREEFNASSLEENPAGNTSPVVAVEKVPTEPVAEVFQRIRPTFLICDIEGAEAWLLPLADLSSVRCAVIELHPQWIGKAGVQAVFDAFQSAGLTFFPRTANKKVVTFRRDW